MLCCCVRRSSSGGRSITSKSSLKDGVVIATCCISFVAAFAVAMTTIAHGGAQHLATSVSILGSIILVPPVLVSLCLSRLTTSQQSQDRLNDEENAAAHEFVELEQLTWTQFEEFSLENVVITRQDVGETSKLSFEGYLRMGGGMQEVLIRALELNSEQLANLDVGELKQEIVKVGSIRRCNVLPMLGFTLDQSRLLLFMPKLRNLTDVLRNSGLSWRCRCRVAALTARGLCRLHHSRATGTVAEGSISIVHGNIRSENIHLLEEGAEDSTMLLCTPYIVDTGLLKLNSMPVFRTAETSSPNKSGYAAPEYNTGGALTTKADVYSFGIVLYVLLSGQTEVTELKPVRALKSRLKRLMDPKLEKLYNTSQAKQIQQTALRCIQADPLQRPDMIRVEAMLRPLLLAT